MMGFHVLSRKRKVLETTTDYPNYQQYTRNFSNMINYIYNQLYNLQGWFVMVSDCEELVGGYSLTNLKVGQNGGG